MLKKIFFKESCSGVEIDPQNRKWIGNYHEEREGWRVETADSSTWSGRNLSKVNKVFETIGHAFSGRVEPKKVELSVSEKKSNLCEMTERKRSVWPWKLHPTGSQFMKIYWKRCMYFIGLTKVPDEFDRNRWKFISENVYNGHGNKKLADDYDTAEI